MRNCNILIVFAVFFLLFSGAVAQTKIFPFTDGHLWGYKDIKGKIVVPPKYDNALPFSDELWGSSRQQIRVP